MAELKTDCGRCGRETTEGDMYGQGTPMRGQDWGRQYVSVAEPSPLGDGSPHYKYQTQFHVYSADPGLVICGSCVLDLMIETLKMAGRLEDHHDHGHDPNAPGPDMDRHPGSDPHLQPVPDAPVVPAADPDATALHVQSTPEDEAKHVAVCQGAQVEPGTTLGNEHNHHGRTFPRRSDGTCDHCKRFGGCIPTSELSPLPALRDLRRGPGKG